MPKYYDLEDRILDFSKKLILFVKTLPKSQINLRLAD